MNEPDESAPSPSPSVQPPHDAAAFQLRGELPRVMRLSRKTLIIGGTMMATFIGGALIYARLASTCFLLCRTNDDGKRGISILLLPMDTPGITVRQIPSIIGEGDIHEVFFDDVMVPATARLGEEGQAWEIISYSLTNERLGIPRYNLARPALDRAVSILQAQGEWDSDAVKIDAANCAALCEAARVASYQIVTRRAQGEAIGAESASARFATVMAERRVAEFVVEYLPEALTDAHPYLKMHHQRGIAAGIAAGSAEILLNLIATEVLKLPREPR